MTILNTLQNSTVYAAFKWSKEWKRTGIILLMDVLFISLLFAAAKIFDAIFLSNQEAFMGTLIGYIFLLSYILIITALYSFFKYCTIEFMFNKKIEAKINAKELGKFYVYNLITGLIILIIGVVCTTFFSVSLVTVLKKTALILFIGLFSVSSYYFMNVSHIMFKKYPGLSLKEIPKKVYETITWKTIGQWIGWNVLILAGYFLLYLLLFMVLKTTAENITVFYIMNLVMFLVIIAAIYVLIFWNRLYLYLKFNTKS